MGQRPTLSSQNLSPAELGRLGGTLKAMETEGAHPYGLAVVRLLAFTGEGAARRPSYDAAEWPSSESLGRLAGESPRGSQSTSRGAKGLN